jgi:hypothetical protein
MATNFRAFAHSNPFSRVVIILIGHDEGPTLVFTHACNLILLLVFKYVIIIGTVHHSWNASCLRQKYTEDFINEAP